MACRHERRHVLDMAKVPSPKVIQPTEHGLVYWSTDERLETGLDTKPEMEFDSQLRSDNDSNQERCSNRYLRVRGSFDLLVRALPVGRFASHESCPRKIDLQVTFTVTDIHCEPVSLYTVHLYRMTSREWNRSGDSLHFSTLECNKGHLKCTLRSFG